MPVTVDDVIDALRPVEDPELHRSIVDLDMVRDVRVDGDAVALEVTLTVAGCPLRNEIQSRVTDALDADRRDRRSTSSFGVMTDEQRAAVREKLHGDPSATAGQPAAHGHAEGRAIPFADPESTTRVLLIASGKGGVGKSSVTTNLSVALAQRGKDVAVIDADVWGFSIPRMLGVEHPPVVIDSMLVPPTGAGGVRCISMGFFAKEDQPVIWRGPMLHKALEQFLTDVFWDDPDFLLVDLPPGTGDISLSLAQFLPRAEVYVVTTPQPAAQKVAQRAGFMAQKVNLEVKGVIENMSWFTGDDGKRYELFGAGGGDELAERARACRCSARCRSSPSSARAATPAGPIVLTDPDGEAAQAFAPHRRAGRGRAGAHPPLPQGAEARSDALGGDARRGPDPGDAIHRWRWPRTLVIVDPGAPPEVSYPPEDRPVGRRALLGMLGLGVAGRPVGRQGADRDGGAAPPDRHQRPNRAHRPPARHRALPHLHGHRHAAEAERRPSTA